MAGATFGIRVDWTQFERAMLRVLPAAHVAEVAGGSGAAAELATATRAAVPKISGRLAGSITVRPNPAGATLEMGTIYAGWVEYGGTRGRQYVPRGRYLGRGLPAATLTHARLTDAAMSREAALL